jgi:hypothetical protein
MDAIPQEQQTEWLSAIRYLCNFDEWPSDFPDEQKEDALRFSQQWNEEARIRMEKRLPEIQKRREERRQRRAEANRIQRENLNKDG